MSIVAGLKVDGRVYMASDSYMAVGESILNTQGAKIFRIENKGRSPILLGVSGLSMIGEALLKHLDWRSAARAKNSQDFIWFFTQQASEVLRESSLLHYDEKERSEVMGGSLLLAWKGGLFLVDAGCTGTELVTYGAVGAGDNAASGVLWLLAGLGWEGERAVRAAVDAACATNPFCRPPITVMEV